MEIENAEASQRTIPHRMIYYVYERMANGRDIWGVSCWAGFRQTNPDVQMDAKTLRSFFFGEVLKNSDHLDGLEYEVLQFINPLFNQFREDVLEYGDVEEGVDFVFEQAGLSTIANAHSLQPILLKPTTVKPSAKVSASSPTVEQIRRHVAEGLSEILWINNEIPARQNLTVTECFQRLALLTQNAIPLVKCIEPGMSCYDRFQRMGHLEPDDQGSENCEEYGHFDAPGGISTPMQAVHPAHASALRKDSALGQSIKDAEKTGWTIDKTHSTSSSSYRRPFDSATPNYASLKHVRSRKRRFQPQ